MTGGVKTARLCGFKIQQLPYRHTEPRCDFSERFKLGVEDFPTVGPITDALGGDPNRIR
jgi:hypothetical protein